jgi:hypothetical protein
MASPDHAQTGRFLEWWLADLPGYAMEVRTKPEANIIFSRYPRFVGDIYKVRRRSNGAALTGLFDDPRGLLEELRKLEHISMYFVANPVRVGEKQRLFPRNVFRYAVSGTCTADRDIDRLRWLLIDIDPADRSHGNSTDDERRHTLDIAWRVAEFAGVDPRGIGVSGNGSFVFVPLSLENTPENRQMARAFLRHLDGRFSNKHAQIDITTYNPSRLAALPGSVKYRGREETKERPYRRVRLRGWDGDSKALTLDRRPVDLRALLPADGVTFEPEEVAEQGPHRDRPRNDPARTVVALTAVPESSPEGLEPARRYLARRPGAIERQYQTEEQREFMRGGAGFTLETIGDLVQVYGIRNKRDLLSLLGPWNLECKGQWTQDELESKIDYIIRNPRIKERRPWGRKPKARTMKAPRGFDLEGL